jgi:hypothetical protein
MRKVFLLSILAVTLVAVNSCKKCFTCSNECVACSIDVLNPSDSTYVTYSHTLCRDSFASELEYNAEISADTAFGYTCANTASTVTFEECTNKPGRDPYETYYNKGGKLNCQDK